MSGKREMINQKITGADPIFIDNNSRVGVLLLHGFTSTPRQFKDLSQMLADKKLTVYAPTLAGHGVAPADLQGTKAEDWRKKAEADYLKLKEHVEKVFIIGVSFGGNVGFYLARKFPEGLSGIISLGTPIRVRFQRFIKCRLALYGWLRPYYSKPRRIYQTDYTDMADEMSYPVIPIKALRQFFKFIKHETVANLDKVKIPAMIMHATNDPVVNPDSAQYIHENLGSSYKLIYWFESNLHTIADDNLKEELFAKVGQFIDELSK